MYIGVPIGVGGRRLTQNNNAYDTGCHCVSDSRLFFSKVTVAGRRLDDGDRPKNVLHFLPQVRITYCVLIITIMIIIAIIIMRTASNENCHNSLG